MKVEYIEETAVRKALSFEIEAEVVDREIATRVREYARKLRLPGFRPGKVPPAVIKQRFRDQLLGDVAESIVNKVVFEELEGRGLKPLAMPKVAELKIDENRPMTFRAVFETLPLVELPDYRGLEARAREPSVSDEDVEREIDRLREQAARFDPVEDRPAARGDFVVADLAWRPLQGGSGGREENALLEVGGEGNHEDVNAALEGMAPQQVKQVTVSYPPEHPSAALAGRTLVYDLTLKAVKRKLVPAADDEFAKDLDHDSLDELRRKLRERLLAADERRVDREVKVALLEALVEQAAFEVPEALVERQMNARTERLARGLASQGVDPRKAGVDWREYRDSTREDSVKSAKADILLEAIARREGIDVLEAELQAELAHVAQRLGRSAESVRARMEKEGELDALRARIREEKTLDLLKANARLNLA